MDNNYKPPFVITENIANLIIETGELAGKITAYDNLSKNPTLRRENRIKTIYSSLAIENNVLTLEQVSAVIDGKRILAPPKDIREVQNAYEAYERLSSLDPYSLDDLLLAHSVMMSGLVKNAGAFRNGQVGVYDGDVLIHAGTPAKLVPRLMMQLFDWLKSSNLHPLVKSCVFHYEFEFIHPFEDGNGRTGRLWQSLILQKWQPFFAWLPVETLVHEKQQGYYDAIAKADKAGDATVFIEYMLGVIRDALQEIYEGQQPK
ncbi:MAG: Fic family protein [Firmicutes bacterium]|nr:Fic family protein [Bacillota bacterium]